MNILETMAFAVQRVRDRLYRVTEAFNVAGMTYAVAGGNAVAAWVATVDPAAIRNTPNVDILLLLEDAERADLLLRELGLRPSPDNSLHWWDISTARRRDALHLLIAKQKVRPEHEFPAPDVAPVRLPAVSYPLLALQQLVHMKLNSFRTIDAVHLRDMLDVGLINPSWPARFPPGLAARLQHLIDNPES